MVVVVVVGGLGASGRGRGGRSAELRIRWRGRTEEKDLLKNKQIRVKKTASSPSPRINLCDETGLTERHISNATARSSRKG